MSHSERAAGATRSWLAALPTSHRLRLALALAAAGLLAGALRWGAGRPGPSAEEWASRPLPELVASARGEPRNPGPPLGLGILYARSGDVPRAVAAFERCLALAPGCLDPCVRLAEIARRR